MLVLWGVLTHHPLRTKMFHSGLGQLASGNKILTLPQDNKACGLRRKKNEKSFCHPSVPPSFGISCQIKSTFFFSYVHTIFFQRWIEFFQLTRLLLYKGRWRYSRWHNHENITKVASGIFCDLQQTANFANQFSSGHITNKSLAHWHHGPKRWCKGTILLDM